jgi:carbon monoxide dehydrogenase subunit G
VEITNDFELALPPEEAYALLLDLERVVPCMPGAELGEPRGDGSRDVTVNVRVGPIKLSYQGSVTITERDDTLRRAVLRGEARELRGQGTASADIAMTVTANGDSGSTVATVADVQLTGRAAQTARGMVKDVAARMIDDMAGCLDSRFSRVTSDGEVAAAPPAAPAQQPIRGGGLLLSVLAGRLRRLFSRSG